jgi:copper oxidase (laccase) domain-containing protein
MAPPIRSLEWRRLVTDAPPAAVRHRPRRAAGGLGHRREVAQLPQIHGHVTLDVHSGRHIF